MERADIIVCGGGTAGLCAAAVAARMGKRVLVLEEDAFWGGAPIDYRINLFCGEPIQGIQREMTEKMRLFNPEMTNANAFFPGSYLLAWKTLLEGLPVKIRTDTHITGVRRKDRRIVSVLAGEKEFCADVYIDATGNGDVAYLAGCDMAYGREAASEFHEKFAPVRADRAVQQCSLMYTVRRKADCTHDRPADWAYFDKDNYLIWGPTETVEDTTDPQQLAAAYGRALDKLLALTNEWDKKGFSVCEIAPKIGVRESRRLRGIYTLNLNDILERKVFSDCIAVATYNIDPWDPDGNPLHRGENVKTPYYQIPYRALLSEKAENLIVAGRCISATHVANSSCRVMAIAGATGHAAGAAAALTQNTVFDVDVQKLRALLKRQGMFVDFFDAEE